MNLFFSEVRALFQKEKVYLFLFVFIVGFYTLVLFFHKTETHGVETSKGFQKIESMLRKTPQESAAIRERLSNRPGLGFAVQLFTIAFGGAFLLGLWFGSRDLWKWFFHPRKLDSSSLPPEALHVTWGVSEVVKVVVLFFLAAISLNLFLALVRLAIPYRLDSTFFVLGHTFILDIAAIFFVLYFIRTSGSEIRDMVGIDLSFARERIRVFLREFWFGLRTYCVILPPFIGLLAILVFLATQLSYEPSPHPLVEVLLEEEKLPLWTALSSLFVACVVGPLVEEIFFRGFLYPALRKYWGMGGAAVITATLFAGVHENIFSFVPIFFLGFVLCFLYETRKNLISCISLHMAHNTAFITYFFLIKSLLLTGGPAHA